MFVGSNTEGLKQAYGYLEVNAPCLKQCDNGWLQGGLFVETNVAWLPKHQVIQAL